MKLDNEKLNKYLHAHAYPATITKARGLVIKGKYDFTAIDQEDGGLARFVVRSEEYSNLKYQVSIRNFLGREPLVTECNCPYNWGGICKHVAATLMALDKHPILAAPVVLYGMLDNTAHLADLSDAVLRNNTSDLNWKNRNNAKIVSIRSAAKGTAHCVVTSQKTEFPVRFHRVKPGVIHTSCACGEKIPDPLCFHKLVALLAIREQYGILAFEAMRDFTEDKNRLLAEYGFSLNEDISGKFDFKINDRGELEMTVLDPGLTAPKRLGDWLKKNEKRLVADDQRYVVPKIIAEENEVKRSLLFAFTPANAQQIPDLTLTPLAARYQQEKDKFSNVSRLENTSAAFGASVEIPPIGEDDSKLISLSRNGFSVNAILAAIRDSGRQMPRWYYQNLPLDEMSPDIERVAQSYIGRIWDKILPLLRDKQLVQGANSQLLANSLSKVQIYARPTRVSFRLSETEDFVTLEALINTDEEALPIKDMLRPGFWFLQMDDVWYKIAAYEDAAVLDYFKPGGNVKVKRSQIAGFLNEFVLPLSQRFSVEFDIEQQPEYSSLAFRSARIYLKEDDNNLLFVPAFAYGHPSRPDEEIEFSLDGKKERVAYDDHQIAVWSRNPAAERPFYQFIQELHPDFSGQAGQEFFYLPFPEVLKQQWLFRFFDQTKEKQIEVLGFSQLKKFKYNPNRPKIQFRAGSGIDWFDMKMDISFGDQFVSLKDIQKAVLNKQNYIQLGDGSIGMLPEEWLERYASLFKFGQVKGDQLKVSKMHFSIIDEFFDQIDNAEVQRELMEKKQKLLRFKEIKDIPMPSNIKAQLRDYQVEGFKWLNFLYEFSWGGCLADDMGLGKTLQVLTLLQHAKNNTPQSVNLVVVPTTLIFNWQAEVEKFASELRVYVHRGVGRQKNLSFLRDFDIVLTTYGTLRSDIEYFKEVVFQYVVLDESQAIKNPNSLISKAVKLLRAKNRLVMTGTPVENNTFDLYSQMEFLNPGLLGSQEFFRSEYATPIDKYRDEKAARELRKLVYPFILKRTKEEVAKDLPDKTETILFCEMGKKQRKVYETFRDMYRARIMDKMAEVGREQAAFLILEGLLKLRQICDSPALLSDDADYGQESVKLDEITREIEENAGHHKILVFSQFLKMLDLVRRHLEKSGIPYEYLDGQTTDRAQRVRRFQESEQCRVFLMSLKAGGVGINLTEADYVYLIDPWWNPAVEQQAIDRTHRIGQEKKVFAYKMICKDTVEEKILQLQDKKKDIAKDLISTEEGLLKKLSREDIVNLFS